MLVLKQYEYKFHSNATEYLLNKMINFNYPYKSSQRIPIRISIKCD